jgi:hypothetical protein
MRRAALEHVEQRDKQQRDNDPERKISEVVHVRPSEGSSRTARPTSTIDSIFIPPCQPSNR